MNNKFITILILMFFAVSISTLAVAPSSVIMIDTFENAEFVNDTEILTDSDMITLHIGIKAIDPDSNSMECTLIIDYEDVNTGHIYTDVNVSKYSVSNNTFSFTEYYFSEYQRVFDIQEYTGRISCNDGTDTTLSSDYTFTVSYRNKYDSGDIAKATINGIASAILSVAGYITIFILLLIIIFGKKYVINALTKKP